MIFAAKIICSALPIVLGAGAIFGYGRASKDRDPFVSCFALGLAVIVIAAIWL